ncbi:MAG: hypothetical protein K6B72_02105 [Lachnospiraceae bacterium]|nr:hypothetical protein [Lachnospiraceae bacterium]
MITERDLEEAIAECKGKRNPDSSTCIKLAAFYTIKEHLYPGTPQNFTYAAPPIETDYSVVDFPGESELARAVDGRRQKEVWPVFDELMATLEAINPRLHDAVMRKLS